MLGLKKRLTAVSIDLVANQPQVVQESVGHFTRALTEAVLSCCW